MTVSKKVVRDVTEPTRYGASAQSSQVRATRADGTLSGESVIRGPPVRQRGPQRAAVPCTDETFF